MINFLKSSRKYKQIFLQGKYNLKSSVNEAKCQALEKLNIDFGRYSFYINWKASFWK
jgi:hypothetical protein